MQFRGPWLPFWLAVLATGLNALKPAVVDDTAYLIFARHLSNHPADPYGFELFWYSQPEPAGQILLPPVVPYWLSFGIRLFGEHLTLLKLWLFPFPLILAFALSYLLERFARGYDRPTLILFMAGPTVLPLINVMLDVPAMALAAAAVSLFIKSCDTGRRFVILAGGVAALAMQTKYTALSVPLVMCLYGVTHQRLGRALLAALVACGAFAVWEGYIFTFYGESHFLYHLREQRHALEDEPFSDRILTLAEEKWDLFQPMLGHLGWIGLGVGSISFVAVVPSRVAQTAGVVLAAIGLIAACVIPARYSNIVPGKLDVPTFILVSLGSATALATLTAAATLLVRRTGRLRRSPDTWFLVLWLSVELGAYFVLTPFPAARRVLMLAFVGAVVAARLMSRTARLHRPPNWLPAVGVASGIGLYAVDTWDALPEKRIAERAIAVCGPGTIWFSGHWGFQYYCDRAGMNLVSPMRVNGSTPSHLKTGDFLVLPVVPDRKGFYRPYHGEANFDLDASAVEEIAQFVWDDVLPAQTIPNLYGGKVPVEPRSHPRLRVAVYRVVRGWTPRHVGSDD